MSCQTCEGGECVCAELDAFLGEAQSMSVTRAARMSKDMFDVGTGTALQTGTKVTNLMLHKAGEYNENDPSMLTVSFGEHECLRLISLLIQAYETNWPGDDE